MCDNIEDPAARELGDAWAQLFSHVNDRCVSSSGIQLTLLKLSSQADMVLG